MTLQNTPLFQNLTQQEIDTLIEQSTTKQVKKGETIFQQSDSTTHLFILQKGQVKLFNNRPGSQKEEIVCLTQPGDHFCLAPLLTKSTYHINAKTTKHSTLIQIPKVTIQNLIRTSHIFAQQIIHYLAKKECQTCERNCDLSLATTKERLAKYLVDQWNKQGKPKSIKLPMNQSQLASHLGTVRETLSRDLAQLKKSGALEITKSAWNIQDHEQLQQIAKN